MRRLKWIEAAAAVAALVAGGSPARAATGDRPADSERLQLEPIIDGRLRYETVDQGALDADSVTFRLRAGAKARLGNFSLLAEGEGTVALLNDYNAFPFALQGEKQWRPEQAVVADPENLELNRLQLQYQSKTATVTVGRQRINLDDQRWVGSVGWRQNEQTFDAVRGELKLGPIFFDATYAINQRTIFGSDAGPRTALDGHFIFAGAGARLGPADIKGFAYLLDYDEPFFLANSSQTYGVIASTAVPLRGKTKLGLRGSYARQSDYAENPFQYAADYLSGEASLALAGFTITGGWEKLGSDKGRAVQTPMATLHKFNGWADLFLTTPAAGLEDAYISIGRKFERVKLLPGLNANLTFHQFDSARSDMEYGTEWDASAGFRIGKVAVLLKYAYYEARAFGSDTRKFWLQAEWAY